MLKPHKRKDAAVKIRTTIRPETLVKLCKQALVEESERWLRVDHEAPDELLLGLRTTLKEESRLLQWRVDIQSAAERTSLETTITFYKQDQTWPFPATMLGLARYEHWMRRLADHVRSADPGSQIEFSG
jgi:hypothetical protein